MSNGSINQMPTGLLKQRIREGYDVYSEACNLYGKRTSGDSRRPDQWGTFPEIADFVGVMRSVYNLVKVRKKNLEKFREIVKKQTEIEEARERAQRRQHQMAQIWENGIALNIEEAMDRLEFKDREACIAYLLLSPYEFKISGSQIIIGELPQNGAKYLESKSGVWNPWKKAKINKSFEKIVDIPKLDNSTANNLWERVQDSIELGKEGEMNL